MTTVEITIKLRAPLGMRLGAENKRRIVDTVKNHDTWADVFEIDVGQDIETLDAQVYSVTVTQTPARPAKKSRKKK